MLKVLVANNSRSTTRRWLGVGLLVLCVLAGVWIIRISRTTEPATPSSTVTESLPTGQVSSVTPDSFELVSPEDDTVRWTFARTEQTALRLADADGVFMSVEDPQVLQEGLLATVVLDDGQGTALLVDLVPVPEGV